MTKNPTSPAIRFEPVTVDPHRAPVAFVDWIVSSGHGPTPGTVYIDLAALDVAVTAEKTKPQAIMQCRLRMSHQTAQNIANALQRSIEVVYRNRPAGAIN